MSTDRGSQAVIYVRISSDPEGERAGVQRQRQECEALAARANLDVVTVFEDNDRSAYSGAPRPAFEAMLAGAAAGDFGHVIVWASDRLYRRMSDLVRITSDLAPYVTIHTVMGGEIDLSSAEGIMRSQVLGSVAEFESRRKGERIKSRARQRAEGGVTPASMRPRGWRWRDPCPGGDSCRHRTACTPGQRARIGSRSGLEPDPIEAPLVAAAYRDIAGGATLHTAWKRAVAAGLPVATSASLGQILRNPRNAGLATLKGQAIGPSADGLSLIDRATFDTVAAILADPSRKTSPGRPAGVALGGGLLKCGRCNGNMASGRKAGAPQYVCSTHHHLTIRRARIDGPALDLVGDVLGLLADHGNLALPEPADTAGADLRSEIATIEQRLESLSALFASGDLDTADYALSARKLRSNLDRLTARLSRRNGRPALGALAADPKGPRAAYAALRARADDGDVDTLRSVLGELLEAITVHRGGEIDLRWKSWVGPAPATVELVAPPAPGRDERRAKVAELHAAGLGRSRIAEELGCYRRTVLLDLRAMGLVA